MSKEEAKLLFSRGLSCSQSVLASQSELTGISVTDSLKLATGFGAGMAMMQKTCGAATGAYMVIGALHGRVEPADKEAKAWTYALIEEFNKSFIDKHGSLSCRELIGVDLQTEEGQKEAKSKNLYDKKCKKYVEDAVIILDEILSLKGK